MVTVSQSGCPVIGQRLVTSSLLKVTVSTWGGAGKVSRSLLGAATCRPRALNVGSWSSGKGPFLYRYSPAEPERSLRRGGSNDAQQLRHAPGLMYAASGKMRGVTVEDLAHAAYPCLPKMVDKGPAEVLQRRRRQASGFARLDIGTEQPWPHGALMIGAIPAVLPAMIAADVGRVGRRQSAQPIGGEQLRLDRLEGLARPRGRDQRSASSQGDQLIGPQTMIVAMRAIDHVVQILARAVPKPPREAGFGFSRGARKGRRIIMATGRPGGHALQGFDPEGVDFHRLAHARREHLVAETAIHPGNLSGRSIGRRQPSAQQAGIGVHADSEAGATPMPLDHILEAGIEVGEQGLAAPHFQGGAQSQEEPKRRVRGIVLERVALVREAVGNQ